MLWASGSQVGMGHTIDKCFSRVLRSQMSFFYLFLVFPLVHSNDPLHYDVLVYAANPGGIGAAIAAADGGKHTVKLMEPLKLIGGMAAAGGVGLMNQGAGIAGVTGLGKKWALLNGAYYNPEKPRMNVFPDMYVAAQSFWKMINETDSIHVSLGCRLVAVSKNITNGCLTDVHFLCKDDTESVIVRASIFIDASYDGEIMVSAGGIDYTHGRESRSTYNESLAGVLSTWDDPNESFDKQDLSIEATFPNGSLIPGISSRPLLPEGSADDSLMAFQYFGCLSNNPDNMIPYPKPHDYKPEDFTLLQRQIDGVMANGRYPNGPDLSYFSEWQYYDTKARDKLLLCCGRGPVNCDQPDLNRGWATANHTERLRMAAAHKYYLLGSLYYMANDPKVPHYTRHAISRWGLCKDEYIESGNWPPQLYIRISNRLKGEFMLTQNNITNPRSKRDSVSMGCWAFDQHTVGRHAIPDPKNESRLIARNEGYMRKHLPGPWSSGNWYDVPFGVMLPKRDQARNLLVVVAISSSSVAYSSTRIEGMFMDLGTAAGVAASLALKRLSKSAKSSSCPGAPVQDTNVSAVQQIIVEKYGQRIHGPIYNTLSEQWV